MSENTESRSHLNEDTLIAIKQKVVTQRWAKYQKRSGRSGRSHRLEIAKGQPLIPIEGTVDCLFMLMAGSIRMSPGPTQAKRPFNDCFHGTPTRTPPATETTLQNERLVKDLPILGARYFFTRRPSSFAYVAETDCSVYTIDSDLIVDIGASADGRGDSDMFLLMRETLINSDVAELFVPEILARLGARPDPLESDFDLLSATETIRDWPVGPPLIEAVGELFEERVQVRIARAEDQGIEASVFAP